MHYFLLAIILNVGYALFYFTILNIGPGYMLFPMLALIITYFVLNVSISIRRFHDFNKSGFYTLLFLIPIINIIFALILLFKKGDSVDNQYGPAIYKSSLYDTLLNK